VQVQVVVEWDKVCMSANPGIADHLVLAGMVASAASVASVDTL